MKRYALWAAGGLLLTALLCLAARPGPAESREAAAWTPSGPAVILDAGHGGEDGGAVSLSGAAESQINLAIALRTAAVLELYGVDVRLLREADVSLHSGGAQTLREKKVSDLKNRAAAVEAVENGVLLSIHQNTFPDPQYGGAQVFYAPTQGSQSWGEGTQRLLREALDPDNGRACSPVPDTVYLMHHISCPAILVECGFLSNPVEDLLLQRSQYQLKVAAVLAAACLQFRPEAAGT